MAICACGAQTTPKSPRCRRCTCRLAQARYRRTAKGNATQARYDSTGKGRAVDARYRSTPRGRRLMSAVNALRIFVGHSYYGRAATVEQAAAIRSHIQERLRAFKRQQDADA